MEKLFFITAMLINLETAELEPKYNQSVYFYDRITCEDYVQKNYTILKNGLQVYLDSKDDPRPIDSLGCTGLTAEEIEQLERLIEEQEEKALNTISA